MPGAVVLLSGGLDSATVLALAREQGFECHALTVLYGQRHVAEIAAAARVAASLRVPHSIVEVVGDAFKGSALTDGPPVPKRRAESQQAREIPATYVPARNTVLLSLALAFAESQGAADIFIGVNAVDYSGYPDCRPEFIQAFQKLAALATKGGVEGNAATINAPLISMSKVDIIREGLRLGVDYGLTLSCYDPAPRARACGECDSCLIRARAFAELGVADPALTNLHA